MSGAQIVYTVSGGTLSGGVVTPTGVTVNTNASGQASASFLSTSVPPGLGSIQSTVTAKAAGSNTVTFYESTYSAAIPPPQPQFLTPQPGEMLTGQAGTVITTPSPLWWWIPPVSRFPT